MLPVICLAAMASAAILVTRSIKPVGLAEWPLFLLPVLSGQILVSGYVLSAWNRLGSIEFWTAAAGLWLVLGALVWTITRRYAAVRDDAGARSLSLSVQRLLQGARALTPYEKWLLLPALILVVGLGAVNLVVAIDVAPHAWDCMTYHLPRMAYYLQRGNLASFDANFWAQVVHPKNSTLLVAFTYLVSGRNENLTQLVQYVSYWVAVASVYGISRRMGSDRYSSLFSATVFALLVECLIQASTAQNDLLIAACTGCAAYGLFAWRARPARRYLVLAALAFAIALGVKASMLLAVPSLVLVGVFVGADRCRRVAKQATAISAAAVAARTVRPVANDLAVLLVAGAIAVSLFVLPAGYLENWRDYGHPLGPESVRRMHSFEGRPIADVLRSGTLNLLRYGVDFVSLDGLPQQFAGAEAWLRKPLRATLETAGIDLESKQGTRAPFSFDRPPIAASDVSYWGIMGFGLVWPVALLALFGNRSMPARVLAAAALLVVVVQSYAGLYEPPHSRYFMIAAIFAVPVLSVWIRRIHRWPVRAYLAFVVLFGCLSALGAVLNPVNGSPAKIRRLDRIGQLTLENRGYSAPARLFDSLVPADATVAVMLEGEAFEYPLFGKGLSRTLIPVNGFRHGRQPIPAAAQYLIYSSGTGEDRRPADIHLGEDWFLRELPGAVTVPGPRSR